MKFVVGLGNPGEKYQGTRHNIGFLVIDALAKQGRIAVNRKISRALIGEIAANGEKLILAKPQTFMNRSGLAVRELFDEFQGSAQDLIVVYDDLDLPFGRLRIRPSGSAGGHRGMLSIIETLEGGPFCRLRVGIGRPPQGKAVIDHVLETFNQAELVELPDLIGRAAGAIDAIIRDGVERAMGEFNRMP